MKKTKLVLILALALICITAFAACGSGGTPSYVKNPPADYEALVARLEANGWESVECKDYFDKKVHKLLSSDDYDDFEKLLEANVSGYKLNVPNNNSGEVNSINVYYFKDKAAATDFYNAIEGNIKQCFDELEEEAKEIINEEKFNVKYSYSYYQSGKTVSLYYTLTTKIR